MSLERLVEEIRRRGEEEAQAEQTRWEAEVARRSTERDRRVGEIRTDAARSAELEAAREHAQKIASARLAARKLTYEARERQTGDALRDARNLLTAYTKEAEYAQVLKRMAALSQGTLGKSVRIYGRKEDAGLLKAAAGKAFDDRTAPILGGLIAETPDGERRLNLSFDELLRLREDRLRELFAK